MQVKILIMAVKHQSQTETAFQSTIDELTSLSETAGGAVVHVVTQTRERIHPATYIGSGKVEEILRAIDHFDIDLVISNDELSSGQLRNLSDRFNVRLIDRSQLILDIFAQRARTKEGQLQVELAQLQYLLPRLRGQGTMLSRLGGGIGTRGPGETQLETDQRHIRRKIDDIKGRLKRTVEQREQYRHRRKLNNVFQIAIVGYTNAGKSTLFNQLTESEAFAENKLFATLDPLTRQLQLPSGFQTLMTDTVGFLQKLPTTLIAAFRSTLEEVSEADFILHVVDSSHEDQEQHQETVHQLLVELNADTIPTLTVYNKSDLLKEEHIPKQYPYVRMSAFNDNDLNDLVYKIEQIITEHWQAYTVRLQPDEGKTMHELKTETIVRSKEFDEHQGTYVVNGYMATNHPLNRLLTDHKENNHE